MNRKIIFGFIAAIIFGVIGLLSGILYGGNYGCFQIADKIFAPLKGYESCGSLGFWIGIVTGAILGVLLSIKLTNSK